MIEAPVTQAEQGTRTNAPVNGLNQRVEQFAKWVDLIPPYGIVVTACIAVRRGVG
jgi:hypothetical protein